ncbi:MAG TPA: fatty acid desaturase [Terriglobales bacterium]|nr:fatty acid desaturase [Terriglobales bacterium]
MNTLTGPVASAGIRKGDIGRHDYVIDGPTLVLAVGIYASFLLLTASYHLLPWYLACPLTALVIALHGSLQHEATHGYPTRWKGLNSFIVGWPLWLWLPYLEYRKTHLNHHIDENLTDPTIDPESNYLTPAQWEALSPLHRAMRQAMRPLFGRMLVGPAYYTVMTLISLVLTLRAGNWRGLRPWALHLPAVALILYWATHICGIPLWVYVFGMAYPGTSLALVRSFAEHRAHPSVTGRTVICQAGPFWSLLFLFNNLHVIHHDEPGLAWYKRSARYLARRDELTARDGAYVLPGYGKLFAKYGFAAKEPLFHPTVQ